MSEQMRKEFEEWFFDVVDGDASVKGLCWQAWQASRAAIVVDTSSMPEASYGGTGVVYLSGVENALEQAGVSYK